MRNVEFSTSKGKFYLVDFPANADRFSVFNDKDNPYISYFKGVDTGRLYVNYPLVLIGNLNEFTEEQWLDVVENDEVSDIEDHRYTVIYIDYNNEELAFDTATKSGISLLKSLDILLENPVKHPKQMKFKPQSFGWYKDAVSKWQESQDKVWLNPVLFKIKE